MTTDKNEFIRAFYMNRAAFPSLAELDNFAEAKPRLSFEFSAGRLKVSRAPVCGAINSRYAPNKTALRRMTYGRIDKIIEVC